jgi:lysophospholipase L1-like esterase
MLSEIRNLILADGGIAPVLLGTQGVSPNQHEGRSGWTFAKYIANTSDGSYNNIFWDTSIEDNNFKKYMADHNFSGDIDYCVIYLGFNDITSVTGSGDASDANLDVIISNAKNLIDDILSSTHGYPNCKIILVFPTLFPIDRTSWASHYSDTTGNLIDLRHKRNMFLYYQKLITNFDNGTYNQNVSVCASSFWMDRSNSFQSFKILSRNRSMRDTTKESYISDVHPSNVGYYYLADAIYSHLRALF